MLCSVHDTLDHRVLRFVSVHFFGPQMFRPPTTDLWHFEHVFLAPTHTQSESLAHGLSFFQGHLNAGDGGSGASPICHCCESDE